MASPPPPFLMNAASGPPLQPPAAAAEGSSSNAPVAVDMETTAPAPAPALDDAPLSAGGDPPLRATRRKRRPYSVETIFRNFTNRRIALIDALTRDQEEFFDKCQQGMRPLYLWGNTDGSWEVKPAELYVPSDLPEPTLGIDISRNKMKRHKWLEEVAMHCDAWLINISFFFLLGPYFTATERHRLFIKINNLPTVRETLLDSLTYQCIRHVEEKRSGGHGEANEVKEEEEVNDEDKKEEEVNDEDKNFCGSCGSRYNANGFWICCNVCDRWYHGKCVKLTASKAESIDHYECPECYFEKVGHDYDEDPTLSGL
ncbi:hypothetical protein U9M48_043727 [Paspalum notatum var. saurae]|uniref:PHD finger protein ALFIN-LIKE n=1 Tax=Paspalum notatum var. saurae TaxID=547442 RepID=A0AAQ3XIV3_PASNO